MAKSPGLYMRNARLQAEAGKRPVNNSAATKIYDPHFEHNGQPHCTFCHARLDVSGGIPLPCNCRWKTDPNRVKGPATQPKKVKPLKPKKPAPPQVLATVEMHNRFKGQCRYCKLPVGKGAALHATKDHFIPKASGGIGSSKNSVLACKKCNLLKGAFNPMLMLEVWFEIDPEGLAAAYGAITATPKV